MENQTNETQRKPILDIQVEKVSVTTEKSSFSVNAMAVLLAVVIVAALAFVIMHIGSIVLIGINVFFGALTGSLLASLKPLKRFGARPEVNNGWTFLLVMAAAIAMVCFRGTNAVMLATLLVVLRLVMSPDKPKVKLSNSSTSSSADTQTETKK